ncbi:MAG: XdhC family protein [Rhodothermales bacterium]|nr:XdhC family protein [Rhodothermales bacterium]
MYEIRQILHHAGRLRAEGQGFALATVVRIGGSTYRRPGARLLIDPKGATWGTISGGCLEGEVAERALEQMKSGLAEVHPFTLGEDDIVLGFGTGCNGIVHVLIEPFAPGGPVPPLDAIAASAASRRSNVLATVLTGSGAWRDAVAGHVAVQDLGLESIPSGDLPEGLHERIVRDARAILEDKRHAASRPAWQNRTYETMSATAEVLFEALQPPIRLLLFGEGHDIAPVVRMAQSLGWEVWIVGRKPEEELARRFPGADRCIFLMHPEEVATRIATDGRTAAFLMNHSYLRDRALLAGLLPTQTPYLGLLGPRSRTARMLEELAETAPLPADADTRIFGPIGLDIGTETPEEIALAALAEAQAILHGRGGGLLRKRTGPIHS